MTWIAIAVGIAGVGKSTYLKPFAQESDAVYIAADQIRKNINGSEENQGHSTEVWREIYRRIDEALHAGRDVVLDSTMYRSQDRLNMVQHLKRHHNKVIIRCLFFVAPIDICVARITARARRVPRGVLNHMHEELKKHPPSREEGFNQVIMITTVGPNRKSYKQKDL